MNKKLSARITILCSIPVCLLLTGALSGCVIRATPGQVAVEGPVMMPGPDVVIVPHAPPPVQAEEIAPPPSPRHVWIAGYWAWRGGAYVWINGCYVIPPHPHAVWIAGYWTRHPHGGWFWVEGRWHKP